LVADSGISWSSVFCSAVNVAHDQHRLPSAIYFTRLISSLAQAEGRADSASKQTTLIKAIVDNALDEWQTWRRIH
jgi:hypothetical protein